MPIGLGPYEDKSTQTYFPAGLGPLTEETALEEQERKWQSRLRHYHEDVHQLVMKRFWRWEERHIKAVESQLSALRETRVVTENSLHKYLDKTHLQGVVPGERPVKRRRRMSH